jgi:hypothetical protein
MTEGLRFKQREGAAPPAAGFVVESGEEGAIFRRGEFTVDEAV